MDIGRNTNNALSRILIIMTLAGLPALFGSGCATTAAAEKKPRTFKQSSVKTLSIIEAAKSADPIDRYAASMIFFKLDKNAEALSISISAEYIADVMGTKKTKKTYFIVEKVVDMSSLKNRKDKYFKNLDGSSLYRIRFTTFSTENVDFTITINADCGVTYLDEIN